MIGREQEEFDDLVKGALQRLENSYDEAEDTGFAEDFIMEVRDFLEKCEDNEREMRRKFGRRR